MLLLALACLALPLGVALAFRFTAGQFAIGLVLIAVGGAIEAHYAGWPTLDVLLGTAGLFALSQVAYVMGVGLRTYLRVRKLTAAARHPHWPGDDTPGPTPNLPVQGEGH